MTSRSTSGTPNRLASARSPYLLQHAYNPVDWFPWGEEALAKARSENKPILVSIGYSACHWCHVMEHECFESDEVAQVMNQYFVNIKIDREERPDIDQIYMEAVQLMGINGGWPLNVFLLPDLRPFYGGTYFPKAQWLNLLGQIANAWAKHRTELEESAEKFREALNRSEVDRFGLYSYENRPQPQQAEALYQGLARRFDTQWGGLNKAPKFPMPSNWLFLMRYASLMGHDEALAQVELTLNRMAQGGIYDTLAGGFARYSVDGEWFAPHFEKMLYDNGQLISLYAEAWQATKNPQYRQVVEQTIQWLKTEMTSAEGAFYSALDADSEGVEGKFYCWTWPELQALLTEDELNLCADYFSCTPDGNWEHGLNILFRQQSDADWAHQHQRTWSEWEPRILALKEKLLAARAHKVRPGLDDKVLCSWNALMLKGLAQAYRVFGTEEYRSLMLANARFLTTQMMGPDRLYHSWKDGKAEIPGFLEDYALLIDALIEVYQATFDEDWLSYAKSLTKYTLRHFFDIAEGLFWYTEENEAELIARKKEFFDNVIPATNSVMASNLYRLGLITSEDNWVELAQRMVSLITPLLEKDVAYLSNWACTWLSMLSPTAEVALTGPQAEMLRHQLEQYYLPNKILVGSTDLRATGLPLLEGRQSENESRIFVCFNRTCQLPVTSVEQALPLLLPKH